MEIENWSVSPEDGFAEQEERGDDQSADEPQRPGMASDRT